MNIHVPNTGPFRNATDMEILERPLEWLREFQSGWLSHFERTGVPDWSQYSYPQNHLAPTSQGISLAKSRLLVISTAGAYYPTSHRPFECRNPLGDYSIRIVPSSVHLEKLEFGHPELDLDYVRKDPQVLLPIKHLRAFVKERFLGSLAPVFISLCGTQPHAIRVVKELIPNILKVAREYQVQAALIIPAGHLCIQTMTAPPRLTATHLPEGSPIGMPGDTAQQRRILHTTLSLLEMNSPTGIIYLDEMAST
jgi:hypothetical protein